METIDDTARGRLFDVLERDPVEPLSVLPLPLLLAEIQDQVGTKSTPNRRDQESLLAEVGLSIRAVGPRLQTMVRPALAALDDRISGSPGSGSTLDDATPAAQRALSILRRLEARVAAWSDLRDDECLANPDLLEQRAGLLMELCRLGGVDWGFAAGDLRSMLRPERPGTNYDAVPAEIRVASPAAALRRRDDPLPVYTTFEAAAMAQEVLTVGRMTMYRGDWIVRALEDPKLGERLPPDLLSEDPVHSSRIEPLIKHERDRSWVLTRIDVSGIPYADPTDEARVLAEEYAAVARWATGSGRTWEVGPRYVHGWGGGWWRVPMAHEEHVWERNAALVGQNLAELAGRGAIDPNARVWPGLSHASRIMSDAMLVVSPEVRVVEMARAVELLVGTSQPWHQVAELYEHAVPIWAEVGALLRDMRNVVHWIGVLERSGGPRSADVVPSSVSEALRRDHGAELLTLLSDCSEATSQLPMDYLLRHQTEQRIAALNDAAAFAARLEGRSQEEVAALARLKRHRNAATHGRLISKRLLDLSARTCTTLANLVTEMAFQASRRDVNLKSVIDEKIARSARVRAEIQDGREPAVALRRYYTDSD